jgi:hypothetical protein
MYLCECEKEEIGRELAGGIWNENISTNEKCIYSKT